MDLKGKTFIVTGGGSGLGEGTCRVFAEAGANVIVADLNKEGGERVAADLGKQAAFSECNVTEEASVQAAVALVEYSCITVRTLLAPGKAGLDGRVLAALREKGEMTREQLGSHFNRHQSAVDLDNALALLANAGLIEQEKVPTKGRSASVYRAAAR